MSAFRRPCRCGHPYDAHQHYTRSARCTLCDWCILYQPRRWWRRAKHPAAGADSPDSPPPLGQGPAGGEPPAVPPAGDGSHLPGRIHRGPILRRIDVIDCGSPGPIWCYVTYRMRDRSFQQVPCPLHRAMNDSEAAFDPDAWEARLP